jgi:2-polyprenyl-3-methyl-5-hydroxy-6-metoxy-1,4-benzoquinol methylase
MQSEKINATEYSGKENLEFMNDAYNYNNYIENFLIKFIDNHKALDFGAASGEYAMRLKNKNIGVDCVEIDTDFIKSLETKGFKTYSSLSDVNQKYHRIYSLDVIEHIENDAQILKDLYNTLSDDGKILIYVPAFNCLYSALDKYVGHFRRYKKSTLLPLMKHTGFQIESARYVDSIGFFGSLYFKYFGSKTGILNDNKNSICFYYKYIFPISIVLDKILNPFIGKNLLVIARK